MELPYPLSADLMPGRQLTFTWRNSAGYSRA